MDEKEEQARRWLEKAQRDLRTAETMLAVDDPPTDVACFHAQQCAEKCLKAVLCVEDRHIPRTHDLVMLIDTCMEFDRDFDSLRPAAQDLADYAVETRYPDDWRVIPQAEASEAIDKAKAMMAFVKRRMAPGAGS